MKIKPRVTEDRLGPTRAGGADSPTGNSELVTLIKQLRDELNAFLNDVERGREFSGNRDPSHRL